LVFFLNSKGLAFADRNASVKRLMSFGELSKTPSHEEKKLSTMRTISLRGMVKILCLST